MNEIIFATPPPPKRRRMEAVRPSPTRLSDLLEAFGAVKSPTSVSKMRRLSTGRELRQKAPINSYVMSESSSSQASPQSVSSFGEVTLPEHEESELEPHQAGSDDEIIVIPRKVATRTLPPRSTRTQLSYARPIHKHKNKPMTRGARKPNKHLLTSDTTLPNKHAISTRVATARSQLRDYIVNHTKPKRDAFILANKHFFTPLLPASNYITKLESAGESHAAAVKYAVLQQPRGVKATMKTYQLEGLSFLAYMYKNGVSAILGDEMGLGKTLQTLALFQHLEESQPAAATGDEIRPHLVVCPLSVLSSWINEARKWVPELTVIRFHGPKSERDRLKKELLTEHTKIDIFVTTYDTFVAEQGWLKRVFVWRYCVLDEGHKIKSAKTAISSALQSLGAEHRLLLTGTPLQNNLEEMWALLHWLYPEIFTEDSAENFKRAFDLSRGHASTTFMDDVRHLLEVIMMRRMKSSPGVNLGLPPKTEVLLYVPLTPMQRFWYTRLLTKADARTLDDVFKDAKIKAQQDEDSTEMKSERDGDSTEVKAFMFDKDVARVQRAKRFANALTSPEDSSADVWAESRQIIQAAMATEQETDVRTSDWEKLMNLVMQLRKVCSHPYLLKDAVPDPYYLGEHMKTASGKFIVLEKLIDHLVLKQGKKIIIFSGFTSTLTLCEDLLALKGAKEHDAKFRYTRLDGGTSRARRNLAIRMFNDHGSDFKVMLISTRAGGLGINLASATNVVFIDEDWNPQITLQAEARAHRIGQTQPVTVYKLCTQGTVEEQMMGRIRKKLYLSAKVTENMRSVHATAAKDPTSKKRKRNANGNVPNEDEPQLDTNQLRSLLLKGAQALAAPQVDVTEMLNWDFETMVERCKDKPIDARTLEAGSETDEQEWLKTMEKVECAVFEGRKIMKEVDAALKEDRELDRADRRIGKNTTVMIDGFAINKESLQCAEWEAVPTFAGKDPRLAEPVREKKAAIENQSFCQQCWDGGDLFLCAGCPRSYHLKCLNKKFQAKAKSTRQFYCPQHECVECEAKTTDAGGLIYRCRWCEDGYCEDCLDWDVVTLVGESLPELEMRGFGANEQAWYIDCPSCVTHWKSDKDAYQMMLKERETIEKDYLEWKSAAADTSFEELDTPGTVTEVATPAEMALPLPVKKEGRFFD